MIGETITVNGVKCLVLDEINGNPFVIALEVEIYSVLETPITIKRVVRERPLSLGLKIPVSRLSPVMSISPQWMDIRVRHTKYYCRAPYFR